MPGIARPWREAAMFNKHMVLTLPARGSFSIIARHKGLAFV
jgi:hypothetical protein